ncbi:hypothetical protein [Bifidobacterium vespertilionis]|uniref:Uncharacterized protein n=1 Tax=Bifidobacterium vespertilionis TaxID=2562524 RepID=A0A5J5DW03_9BIFI|nr:hypothetical protein [Bifidobacterium vespertilionis]KAA8815725.1 hypothetical protein EMO90_11835 [Bifidobacterium vespertilionis]KAA8821027.1 hypothetical protein EM848_11595 [Bifidobacterium vespertilionis]
MSRGLGKVERELLSEVKESGEAVRVTDPGWEPKRNEVRRRAARSLEAKGLIGVYMRKSGRHRHLMVCSLEYLIERKRSDALHELNETRDAFEDAVRLCEEAKPNIRIPRIVYDNQPMTEDYPEQEPFDGEELDS